MRDLRADITEKATKVATEESRNAVSKAFDEKILRSKYKKWHKKKLGQSLTK
jgi:hypothetical protein